MADVFNDNIDFDSIDADVDVLESTGDDAEMDSMEDTRLDAELEETQDMSILQRAKDNGLKVTDDGRIILPGSLKGKAKVAPKSTPKTKVPVVPKPKIVAEPKPFKGINSAIFSTGDTLNRVINGLTIVRDAIKANNVTCPYKLSTYKNELRLAFDTCKGVDILNLIPREIRRECEFTVPDKKDFLTMTIA